ncbi:hypothetical protein LCGC14_2320030, partial [marine sediment metagenome]
FSFNASGQLAKALVYFPFKGLDVVRSYVVPANPNSAAQQTQRGHMTDAVDEWHTAGYTDEDRSAWNRLAGTLGAGLSGFNAMVRSFINEEVAGGIWTREADAVISAVGAAGFTVNITKVSAGLVPLIRWGVSPTFMPNNQVFVDQTGNDWESVLAGLNASTLYYFTVDVGVAGATFGRMGIYTQRTT